MLHKRYPGYFIISIIFFRQHVSNVPVNEAPPDILSDSDDTIAELSGINEHRGMYILTVICLHTFVTFFENCEKC